MLRTHTDKKASMVTIAIPAMMSLFFDGRRAGSGSAQDGLNVHPLNTPSASSADMLPVIKLLSAISCPFSTAVKSNPAICFCEY